MKRDWDKVTIGDIATLQRGFDIPPDERGRGGNVPVISSGGISAWHNEAKEPGPGVLVGRKGTLGSVHWVVGPYWPNSTCLWVKDFHGNVPRFVYYFFKARSAEMLSMDVGAANPTLNRNHVHPLPAVRPPRREQEEIAGLLGALDDKIELNRRMNGTLEAMAQALFKEWFVDGAKEEWEEMMLDEVAYYRNGLALQRFRPKEGEEPLPAVKIAQMRTGLPDSGEWASPNIDSECILYDGDVVFSWSGSLIAILWCGGKAALNQHLFKVTSEKFPKWFYYLWTQEYMPEFQGIASNKATTMGHINRNHLKVPVPIPPAELLKRGDETIAPLLERIVTNNLESRTLTALRDTLLPKLMRGEVRVKQTIAR